MDQPDAGAKPETARRASRGGLFVTVAAWAIALLLIGGLSWAVAQRLGEAGAALKDAIQRSRTQTSVVYEANVIAPPVTADAAIPDSGAFEDNEGRTVVPPRWIEVPSPDYPVSRDGEMVPGTVVLSCRVTTTGLLETCQVASEDPIGRGFREAALEAVARARLSPRTVDGVAEAGQVRFAMRFTPEPRLAG
ncbi:TonB family protein [Brevundimonas bacteroides]|uniref:TonB family protein n=1 Tax=Brevundimonas bacteroides TaxID=74311 RepID=UPI0004971834|nr:TonB family protein [Brevundimonas bacteroides]